MTCSLSPLAILSPFPSRPFATFRSPPPISGYLLVAMPFVPSSFLLPVVMPGCETSFGCHQACFALPQHETPEGLLLILSTMSSKKVHASSSNFQDGKARARACIFSQTRRVGLKYWNIYIPPQANMEPENGPVASTIFRIPTGA